MTLYIVYKNQEYEKISESEDVIWNDILLITESFELAKKLVKDANEKTYKCDYLGFFEYDYGFSQPEEDIGTDYELVIANKFSCMFFNNYFIENKLTMLSANALLIRKSNLYRIPKKLDDFNSNIIFYGAGTNQEIKSELQKLGYKVGYCDYFQNKITAVYDSETQKLLWGKEPEYEVQQVRIG